MELHNLSVSDIHGLDPAGLRQTEKDIRKQLGTVRMDVYKTLGVKAHTVRGLKRSLARLLTVETSKRASTKQAVKSQKAKKVK